MPKRRLPHVNFPFTSAGWRKFRDPSALIEDNEVRFGFFAAEGMDQEEDESHAANWTGTQEDCLLRM